MPDFVTPSGHTGDRRPDCTPGTSLERERAQGKVGGHLFGLWELAQLTQNDPTLQHAWAAASTPADLQCQGP